MSVSNYLPIDDEDFLSQEDICFLKARMKRSIRQWTKFSTLVALIVFFSFDPSLYEWIAGIVVWFGIAVMKFLGTQNIIEKGKKKILRGTISQRYKSEDKESSEPDYVFYINGKRLAVSKSIFSQYFTRDFAEFHYLEGTILQHRLLKRGDKEYV